MKSIPGIPDLTIGSIYCIGRNYQKHAQEMQQKVPTEPIVFLKPASSLIRDGETIHLPPQSLEVHHEVELVIAIGRKGHHIKKNDADIYIAGYGIGIDVTARDIQQRAKKHGHPWTVAKGFDTFAPISIFKRVHGDTNLNSLQLSLQVNGDLRQQDSTQNMIFGVEEIIMYLSTIFTLHPGDLIFTGTPEGVSEIKPGDKIETRLNNNEDEIKLTVSVDREEE
ncbi:MAG TPA: fumarylacetoacetate hydrolase family protein [Balneolaceae bacterium]|nr:fumarylacetoacetate hydrolase family protein [Balneolaceae bacterium]